MKLKNKIFVAVLFFLLNASMATAENNVVPSGFSGYVAVVTGQVTSTSNTFAVENEGNTIYNHYGALDDPINVGIFKWFGEIRYNFETQTQVYLGVPYDINSPSRYYNDIGRNLGVSQLFEDNSRLDVSVFVAEQQVWENPYLTNEERKITSLKSIGFVVDYHNILGSSFNLLFRNERFSFKDDEDDVPARFYPDLNREGEINQAEMGYDILMNQSNLLIPKLSYAVANMKGESNSYKGYGAAMAYTLDMETIIFDVNIEAEMNHYEKTDPLFAKTRKDKIFRASLGVTLLDRLGMDGVFVNGSIGYSITESTVSFYNAEEMYTLFVIGYRF